MFFSSRTRQANIDRLKNETFELLIIGGGITGAGLALDAASRGIKVALVEMQDFAAGTSNRSTKLIHGGLRYLKQFDVENVAEVSRERAVIYRNASHIVRPTPMILPVYDEPGASFTAFSAEVALDLYDRLSQVQDEYRHSFLTAEEALNKEPTLKKEGLKGAGVYLDYSSDDARLTLEVIKTAHRRGAVLVNYARMTDFVETDGLVTGIRVRDLLANDAFETAAALVLNATGPWSDEIRQKAEADFQPMMRPTKGVHLVVDRARLPVNSPVYFDSGFNDNRMIFVIPRKNKTYFGTTDTDYDGDLMEPGITKEDVVYLLETVNHRFEGLQLTEDDIEASWSGVRPLIQQAGKTESEVSRGSSLTRSASGMFTIAGGKLTDYRRMAEETLKQVVPELARMTGRQFPETDTRYIRLTGGELPLEAATRKKVMDELVARGMQAGLEKQGASFLAGLYGSEAVFIFEHYGNGKKEAAPGLSLADTWSLHYAMEYELTLTPLDYFLRRTDHLLFDREHLQAIKGAVLDEMNRSYNWSRERRQQLEQELEQRLLASIAAWK